MLKQLYIKLCDYISNLAKIDLLEFNRFIFKHLIIHLFRTENILPFIIAMCITGFSVIAQASRFIFVPQTTIASFASFIIFTLAVSFITLLIYPILLILIVNFIASYIKGPVKLRLWLKFFILIAGFSTGIYIFTSKAINLTEKIQIVIVWVGLYFILSSLFLTHLKHNSIAKISKTNIIIYSIIALFTTQPLVLIYLHISEAMNFTNINPQVYLTAPNCELLRNLDGVNRIPPNNNIFFNPKYYIDLPNQGGCFIYGNNIRYSFAYDFVLLVKKNIQPLPDGKGHTYNEYVRLSCYAGNCYSENHIYFRSNNDLYDDLIKKGAKLDRPL